MGAALWSESIGKTRKVHLVNRVEHLNCGSLCDLILEHSDAQRPLPAIRLWNIAPFHRFGAVSAALQSARQIQKVFFTFLTIACPAFTVDPRRYSALKTVVGLPEAVNILNVMPQRGHRQH